MRYLKNLLLLLLALPIVHVAIAQEPSVIVPGSTKNNAVKVLGTLYVDSSFYIPIMADTPQVGSKYRAKRSGQIMVRLKDTTIYVFVNGKYSPLKNNPSGGGGSETLYTASSGIVKQGNNFKLQDTLNGPGSKLIWMPAKGAFRVGLAQGTEWDEPNIGIASVGLGFGSKASGSNSISIGPFATANAYNSTAIGPFAKTVGSHSLALSAFSATAEGGFSTAIGFDVKATGDTSVSIGAMNSALGTRSIALGYKLRSKGFGTVAIGSYNDTTSAASAIEMNPLNRVLDIGTGLNANNLRSSLVVLQNGKTGVGTLTPDSTLSILGGFKYQHPSAANGRILQSDANGGASWTPVKTVDGNPLFGTGDIQSKNFANSDLVATKSVTHNFAGKSLIINTLDNFSVYGNNLGFNSYPNTLTTNYFGTRINSSSTELGTAFFNINAIPGFGNDSLRYRSYYNSSKLPFLFYIDTTILGNVKLISPKRADSTQWTFNEFRKIKFPDKSGTIALLSDITSPTDYWKLMGNSLVTGAERIGTKNNYPLKFISNGTEIGSLNTDGSFNFGYYSSSTNQGISLGNGALSDNSISLGASNNTLSNGIAVGTSNYADGSNGLALSMGKNVNTSQNAIGIGDNMTVPRNTIAIGTNPSISTDGSGNNIVIGNSSQLGTTVANSSSVIIGANSLVYGDNNTVIGSQSLVFGNNAIALGNEAQAGDNTFSISPYITQMRLPLNGAIDGDVLTYDGMLDAAIWKPATGSSGSTESIIAGFGMKIDSVGRTFKVIVDTTIIGQKDSILLQQPLYMSGDTLKFQPDSILVQQPLYMSGDTLKFNPDSILVQLPLYMEGDTLKFSPTVGTATLVAGTVTVSTTAVRSASKIFVSVNTPGGTQGFISAPTSSISDGVSFVINSTSNTETSTVNWWVIN